MSSKIIKKNIRAFYWKSVELNRRVGYEEKQIAYQSPGKETVKRSSYSSMTKHISKSEHSEEYYQKLDTVGETDYTKTF